MANRSYESIQTEIARLQSLAKKLKKQHRAAKQRARHKVFVLMKKLGLTLGDLVTMPSPSATRESSDKAISPKAAKGRKHRIRKAPIKYRGPHRGNTWTGRGKTPRWLAAIIATGRKKEDYLISK